MHMSDNAFTASNILAEMAEDVYNNRDKIIDKDEIGILVYRLSITDRATDKDHNFFFYIAFIRGGHVWYTVSDKMIYGVEETKLVFDTLIEDQDYLERASSYRRYIFGDLFAPAVRAKIEKVQAMCADPADVYLWDTFDFTKDKADRFFLA